MSFHLFVIFMGADYGKETIGWSKSETEMGQFVGQRTSISWSDHLLQDEIQIETGL
jgi:hypothetical protein